MRNNLEWKSIFLTNIFDKIQRGKRYKNADHVSGFIPYVSSSEKNNGVDDFVKEDSNIRTFQNCISLANSGSVGTAFYEPFRFVASDHITSLKKQFAGKLLYFFLLSVIEKQKNNFNFNREINDFRIQKMRILLPVTESGDPNFDYMEQYAFDVQKRLIERYKQYIKKRIQEIEYKEIPKLEEKQWNIFSLKKFFRNYHGKRLIKENRQLGKIPLLTAGKEKQGVADFISNEDMPIYNNFISIDMFGMAFFHNYKATGDDNIYFFENENIKNAIKIFIVVCCNKQSLKFSFGKQFRQTNAENLQILLPVTESGEPDFVYMEQYAKNMMLKKYRQYLAYLDRKN